MCDFPQCRCRMFCGSDTVCRGCGHGARWHKNEGVVGSHVASIVNRHTARQESNSARVVEEQRQLIDNLLTSLQSNGPAMCCICMERQCDIVVKPCGHARFCERCIERIRVRESKCPLCRGSFDSTVTFIAL